MRAAYQPAHAPPHAAVGACLGRRETSQRAVSSSMSSVWLVAGSQGTQVLSPGPLQALMAPRTLGQPLTPGPLPLAPAWPGFSFRKVSHVSSFPLHLPHFPLTALQVSTHRILFSSPSFSSFTTSSVLDIGPWALLTLGQRFHFELCPQLS